ncbi:MAG: hypothetical protein HY905_20505 [Deltaproteobacteria bacterium]|nr:hypothetical protein [Deltaproteobacteria bacterium]
MRRMTREPSLASRRPEPCEVCDSWEDCPERSPAASGRQGCFRPRRQLELERVRAHFRGLRRAAALRGASLPAMEANLLAHFARAMRRYSDILEFSFSARGRTASPYRFSYSFPAFGMGRARAEAKACGTLVEPFGAGARRVADAVLALARPPLVAQILFGLDAGRANLRLKLYLQFHEGMAREKLGLLSRSLPLPATRRLADAPERLHLLGIDFRAGGVVGAKLYYLRSRVALAGLRRAFPRAGLFAHLADRGRPAALDDVVLITRLGPGGEPDGPPVSEIDLGLRANGLGWDDVRGAFARRAVGKAFDGFRRTALAGHRWTATRISFPVAGSSKLSVYYVLLDPPRRREAR